MEMTARLGLKAADWYNNSSTCGSRNGDDSPVGIESEREKENTMIDYEVEMEMTARLGLKAKD